MDREQHQEPAQVQDGANGGTVPNEQETLTLGHDMQAAACWARYFLQLLGLGESNPHSNPERPTTGIYRCTLAITNKW